MRPIAMFLALALLVWPASLIAERPGDNSNTSTESSSSPEGSGVTLSQPTSRLDRFAHPFTFGATMESASTLGGQFTVAESLNRYMNLRSNVGLLIGHKWVTHGGFTSHASITMQSIGTSLDFYPFPNHGLRFSPGILFHSEPATAAVRLAPFPWKTGPFTVNGHTYYAVATPCPKCGPMDPQPGPEPPFSYEHLQLPKTAFTMTTGWGNMIPRKKTGPWSFPVEVGVAFLGSPSLRSDIQNQICDAQYQNCQDAAKNPQFQSDVEAAIGSYKDHMDLLKTYPIISFGLAYSFEWRTTMK